MWQHRNAFLHDNKAAREELRNRTEALKEAPEWYNMKHTFPLEDQVHFHRMYVEQCSDTTKQVCMWLQKITDLYNYNSRRTLQSFFT